MNKGDIIREKSGADYSLWRIEETYEKDSPYVFAVLVSNHKFHKAGTEKKMARKELFKVEADPAGYAKGHLFTVNLDAQLAPDARYA